MSKLKKNVKFKLNFLSMQDLLSLPLKPTEQAEYEQWKSAILMG